MAVFGRDSKRLTSLILTIVALAAFAVLTVGQVGEPTGPNSLTEVFESRFDETGALSTTAQAGNVTELTITALTATKAWQGYYGNVSGNITLENANGDIFYDWITTEPEGEIYASTNSTITWNNINCFEFNNATSINRSSEETRYGMDTDDIDGIDETFNETRHDTFYIGTREILTNTCPSTNVYQSSAAQDDNFQNVLLTDPDTNSLIFTTIMENRDASNDTDLVGYDGSPTDFQLLVAEDEHTLAAEGPTTYFFWVELE